MKKWLGIVFVVIFVLSSFRIMATTVPRTDVTEPQIINKTISFDASSLEITDSKEGTVLLRMNNQDSYLLNPGQPMLPRFLFQYDLPFGATNINVEVHPLASHTQRLTREIRPAPAPMPYTPTAQTSSYPEKDQTVYSTDTLYPDAWFGFHIGCGLNKHGEHITLVSVNLFPVRYRPVTGELQIADDFSLSLQYQPPAQEIFPAKSTYDLVIIGPEIFSAEVQQLIDHKTAMGVRSFLKTTEEIYDEYDGVDKPEQIKYFIKDAIETYGISYVLLVGDINQMPMRIVRWDMNDDSEIDMLVDLYYSDIYNASGEYCSWDANHNLLYGEKDDDVDFYPDVHLGRLACTIPNEAQTVVEKIITYETDCTSQDWFHRLIVMAGDTFPEDRFPGATGREGEEQTTDIMNIMSQFNHTTLWTSQHNFNKKTINTELSKGAGFVFYTGHGFPNGICPEGGSIDPRIHYYSRNLNGLTNDMKLPIVFLTACSTAKLDFSRAELLSYYLPKPLISFLQSVSLFHLERLVPCFAWNFVKQDGGGSIASIGSTQLILSDGFDYGGCVNPPYYFFESYNLSERLGEMVTAMINRNIQDIPTDRLASYTIMEHILLGDPSLKLDGFR
jgi:hypothetical protein